MCAIFFSHCPIRGRSHSCHAEWVGIDMAFWWHSEATLILSDCSVTAPNHTSSLSWGTLLNVLIERHRFTGSPSSETVNRQSDICQSNVLIFSYIFAVLGQKVVLKIFLKLTSIALTLQSSWLQSHMSHTYWKEEILSPALDTFFPGIAQLHPGPWRHAAHDAGSGLHLHRVHEHQEPGSGEGDAAQRGAACRWHPELGPVGLQVHREHCSARGSLWAHKYPGQGQWESLNRQQSEHKAWTGAFFRGLIIWPSVFLTSTSWIAVSAFSCFVFRLSRLRWLQQINMMK